MEIVEAGVGVVVISTVTNGVEIGNIGGGGAVFRGAGELAAALPREGASIVPRQRVAGLIADANYVTFTNRYQSERTKIQGKITVLDEKLEQQVDYQNNAEQPRQAISSYLNIETLTPLILNKLVEKIEEGYMEKFDG